ncbi:gyd domain protein [Halobacteriales archaeon QS_4_66_20]|nr:MAG: gyd domain protein [Halobacteriales archaeon QS_4_66_20]
MSETERYTKYAILAQLQEAELQNPHDMASMWGTITNECGEIGVEILDSYAVLGQYDFLVIADTQSRGQVLQAALIMERYGLDVQTMEIVSTDEFAQLVEDVA